MKVEKWDERSLCGLREEHREEMGRLLELNRRVVGNLGARLEEALERRRRARG